MTPLDRPYPDIVRDLRHSGVQPRGLSLRARPEPDR